MLKKIKEKVMRLALMSMPIMALAVLVATAVFAKEDDNKSFLDGVVYGQMSSAMPKLIAYANLGAELEKALVGANPKQTENIGNALRHLSTQIDLEIVTYHKSLEKIRQRGNGFIMPADALKHELDIHRDLWKQVSQYISLRPRPEPLVHEAFVKIEKLLL